MNGAKRSIAFVVQRYGEEITGGSELHCREVAERMAKRYRVDVLTTCATDHLSWKNVLPQGETASNGVTVRRFPVKSERRLLDFHKLYDRIFSQQLSAAQEHDMIRLQGPECPELLAYIDAQAERYDAFVFFTYLYYPTVYGLPRVKEKAIFVPTAHDEASLYVRVLDELFQQTPRILFNSEEERFLLQRRFHLPEAWGRVVGVGLEEPSAGEADALWDRELRPRVENRPVLTYVGRVENGKGCDELVEFFRRYVDEDEREDLVLLLLGKRTLPLEPHRQILSPGFVSERVKYNALQASAVAIAPSPFESLCLSALEAWMHRKPLLANGRCAVLVGHCLRSNGGLWYSNYGEFRESLRRLLPDAGLRRALGEQGREYVTRNYRWPVVEQAYVEELEQLFASAAQTAASR